MGGRKGKSGGQASAAAAQARTCPILPAHIWDNIAALCGAKEWCQSGGLVSKALNRAQPPHLVVAAPAKKGDAGMEVSLSAMHWATQHWRGARSLDLCLFCGVKELESCSGKQELAAALQKAYGARLPAQLRALRCRMHGAVDKPYEPFTCAAIHRGVAAFLAAMPALRLLSTDFIGEACLQPLAQLRHLCMDAPAIRLDVLQQVLGSAPACLESLRLGTFCKSSTAELDLSRFAALQDVAVADCAGVDNINLPPGCCLHWGKRMQGVAWQYPTPQDLDISEDIAEQLTSMDVITILDYSFIDCLLETLDGIPSLEALHVEAGLCDANIKEGAQFDANGDWTGRLPTFQLDLACWLDVSVLSSLTIIMRRCERQLQDLHGRIVLSVPAYAPLQQLTLQAYCLEVDFEDPASSASKLDCLCLAYGIMDSVPEDIMDATLRERGLCLCSSEVPAACFQKTAEPPTWHSSTSPEEGGRPQSFTCMHIRGCGSPEPAPAALAAAPPCVCGACWACCLCKMELE
jgi:hypothetical protein